MNYLLNKIIPRVPKGSLWSRVAIIFIIAIFSINAISPRVFDSLLYSISVPSWELFNSIWHKAVSFSMLLKSKYALIEENRVLNFDKERNRLLNAELDLLNEENKLLKEELGRTKEKNSIYIVATVLRRPPYTAYDTAIIDAGSLDGVIEGDLVVAGPVSVGRIAEVSKRSSVVELFSSYGIKTDASISHSAVLIPVVAEGQGNGSFIAQIPRNLSVDIGDALILPGFPKRILGVVSVVEEDQEDPFKKIYFTNMVNLSGVDIVSVLHFLGE